MVRRMRHLQADLIILRCGRHGGAMHKNEVDALGRATGHDRVLAGGKKICCAVSWSLIIPRLNNSRGQMDRVAGPNVT